MGPLGIRRIWVLDTKRQSFNRKQHYAAEEKSGSNGAWSASGLTYGLTAGAGLAAGVHSGLTYGLTEVRGTHDWRNSAVAGAITGAAVALTSDRASHEQVVQCAIVGAALSTAANVLSGIF
ncbi:hypothetical protein BAE44_0009998 [Dichanthelium oligosanthes]|uniref:Outer envelope pore protein 16-2, chloroplastic n=1 Tax=Dichanthelium oligosanthes TaxID=888268 RepID=A0A1E5VV23_9POAL|nr:hypothetical protein BAE44_0009998 [Dichanthelium oligosanthes]